MLAGIIYLFHALVVGPAIIWLGWHLRCCTCKNKVAWLPNLLMVVGAIVVMYHLWSFIRVNKMIEFFGRENFVHPGGSLGIPLWGVPDAIQPFTDFSFPYQQNDHCFYSYHDPVNKRKCPCDPVTGVCTCQPNGNCTRSGPKVVPVSTAVLTEGFSAGGYQKEHFQTTPTKSRFRISLDKLFAPVLQIQQQRLAALKPTLPKIVAGSAAKPVKILPAQEAPIYTLPQWGGI